MIRSVVASHTYRVSGELPITLAVTDDDHGVGYQSTVVSVMPVSEDSATSMTEGSGWRASGLFRDGGRG